MCAWVCVGWYVGVARDGVTWGAVSERVSPRPSDRDWGEGEVGMEGGGGISDCYHGHGKETWDYNTICYEGDFKEGQKTGKGKFDFEGNSYEGDFING